MKRFVASMFVPAEPQWLGRLLQCSIDRVERQRHQHSLHESKHLIGGGSIVEAEWSSGMEGESRELQQATERVLRLPGIDGLVFGHGSKRLVKEP